jgi:hypothetical protein
MNHNRDPKAVRPTRFFRLLAGILAAVIGLSVSGAELPSLKFTTGSATDLQALFDQAPPGAVVVCEQTDAVVVAKSLTITRPMSLRGLKAALPKGLGDTPILIVEVKGVTLTDIEMYGNFDSVDQKHRSPFIHIKAGDFRVERCKFYDGTKDCINVTPDEGTGDIVRGVIRDIQGFRIGRDVVSLSGGCVGQRIRDVTVENIGLEKGYYRGAVEVSDGTDNITVRHVRATNAVYAIDVQDHGSHDGRSAPNTNVILEDVSATRCQHVIRTANRPLGHANLTLTDFAATDCKEPVRISNTAHVRVTNLTIVNESPLKQPPIALHNCDDVEFRNVRITGLKAGVKAVQEKRTNHIKIVGRTRDDKGAKK